MAGKSAPDDRQWRADGRPRSPSGDPETVRSAMPRSPARQHLQRAEIAGSAAVPGETLTAQKPHPQQGHRAKQTRLSDGLRRYVFLPSTNLRSPAAQRLEPPADRPPKVPRLTIRLPGNTAVTDRPITRQPCPDRPSGQPPTMPGLTVRSPARPTFSDLPTTRRTTHWARLQPAQNVQGKVAGRRPKVSAFSLPRQPFGVPLQPPGQDSPILPSTTPSAITARPSSTTIEAAQRSPLSHR